MGACYDVRVKMRFKVPFEKSKLKVRIGNTQ